MKTVIFACIHNAGRSQIAAAFFNQLVASKVKGISAGTQPADQVHPEVLAVMNEVEIDLSNTKPTLLTEELAKGATLLVTMGCGENCPYIPGLEVLDWQLPDPKGKTLDEVRKTRDKIKELIQELIEKKNWR